MERELILFEDKFEDEHYITRLIGNDQDETLYAEFLDSVDGKISYDTTELAVHVNDIVKIRDFCNKLISKIGPAGEYTADNILVKL